MKKLLLYLLCLCLLVPLLPRSSATEPKFVALTFDDGPAGRITQKLLTVLEERGVPATFFLCGYRIASYPELLKKMVQDGHEIGLHGNSHEYFTKLSAEALREELRVNRDKIAQITGVTPKIVRPPGGLYNKGVLQILEEEKLSLVLWNLDPQDWDPAQRSRTASRVVNRVKSGDIVLLHDLSVQNVDVVLEMITVLEKEGFVFCTVSQLAELSQSPMEAGKIHRSFSFSQGEKCGGFFVSGSFPTCCHLWKSVI